MHADPATLTRPPQGNPKLDRQVYLNAVRRGNSLPLSPGAREDASRKLLLEYAAFVLEQQARYCQ